MGGIALYFHHSIEGCRRDSVNLETGHLVLEWTRVSAYFFSLCIPLKISFLL